MSLLNSNIVEFSRHLTQTELMELKTGLLQKNERLGALTHLSECEKCAEQYANCFIEEELLTLSEDIFEKLEKKISEQEYLEKPNKRQFFYYSMKVGIACCAAIILTFSVNFNTALDSAKVLDIKPLDLGFLNTVTASLKDFSQKNIIKMEDMNNDK